MGFVDATEDQVDLIYRWLDHDGSGVIPYRELDQKLRERPIEAHTQLRHSMQEFMPMTPAGSPSAAEESEQPPLRLRPSAVFVSPTRPSCLAPSARPKCISPGYYDGLLSRVPHTLAASVPRPHQNSAAFLRPATMHRALRADCVQDGRPAHEPFADEEDRRRREMRRRLGRLGRTKPKTEEEPDAARPGDGAGTSSASLSASQRLRQRQRELSPSHFAAEIEGTLEHRIARTVVIPATQQVLCQMHERSSERFWTAPTPVRAEDAAPAASTLSLRVASFR